MKRSTMTQFSSVCHALGLPLCFSGSSSVQFGRLGIYYTTRTIPFGCKPSRRKHLITCDKSCSHFLQTKKKKEKRKGA
jgi:hypothetical protein